MIDILIPLSCGAKNDNSELRYALRSISANVKDLGRIFVVTTCPPDWLKDVEIIPVPDVHTCNKDANLFDKILYVCKNTDISEQFLVWSDDQVALKPVDLNRLNIYNPRNRETFAKKDGKWSRRMINTLDYLASQGVKINYNWDSHTPHLYNKADVIRILESVNYADLPGYCLDTLLCGLSGKTPDSKQEDVKYTAEVQGQGRLLTLSALLARPYSWLGYNDWGFNSGVKEYLDGLFPAPSRFEEYPEIDVVLSYVDPTDKEWQAELRKVSDIEPDAHCRFRSFDNIQFIFRGIEKFMPWVRQIYFVVQSPSQIPDWLDCNNPKLKIVYHQDYIPPELLPTFNSSVIEMFLHRIKGLSEHFLYFNDDMFPLAEISPDCFFDRWGNARILQNPRTPKTTNQFQKMLNNNEELLRKRYRMEHGYQNDHLAFVLIRSMMRDVVEDNIDAIMDGLSDSPIRQDKNYTLHLVKNYIIYMSRSSPSVIRGLRVELRDGDSVKSYPLEQIVCYNDNPKLVNDFDRVKKELITILSGILPDKSSYECKTMGCGCKKKLRTSTQIKKEMKIESNSEPPMDDKPLPNDPIVQRRFWDSLKAYAAANIEWFVAGKPTRTKEEMLERFMMCQSCPYFISIDEDNKRGRCAKCGCYLGVNPHRFLEGNKIAMKTQHCPDGRWE